MRMMSVVPQDRGLARGLNPSLVLAGVMIMCGSLRCTIQPPAALCRGTKCVPEGWAGLGGGRRARVGERPNPQESR